jgi:hypothetical protein
MTEEIKIGVQQFLKLFGVFTLYRNALFHAMKAQPHVQTIMDYEVSTCETCIWYASMASSGV